MGVFDFYFSNYRKLVFIPLFVILLASVVNINQKLATGSFFIKDVSLSGGTVITFQTGEKISELETKISAVFEADAVVRELKDALTQSFIGYEIQIGKELERNFAFDKLSEAVGFQVDKENSNFGLQSSIIASSFFKDALKAFAIAFILMGFVMVYYFKNPVPAFTILLSTVADVICIIAVLNLFGIRFGMTSIAALLMIIGFSTDSDILLSTYMMKRRDDDLKSRMKRAILTEFTIELAAYTSFGVMFIFSNVDVIRHIALILLLGTIFDSINTWLLSAGLQRRYMEARTK